VSDPEVESSSLSHPTLWWWNALWQLWVVTLTSYSSGEIELLWTLSIFFFLLSLSCTLVDFNTGVVLVKIYQWGYLVMIVHRTCQNWKRGRMLTRSSNDDGQGIYKVEWRTTACIGVLWFYCPETHPEFSHLYVGKLWRYKFADATGNRQAIWAGIYTEIILFWKKSYPLMELFHPFNLFVWRPFFIGAIPHYVAPMRSAPHIHADVAWSTLRAVDQPTWQDVWRRSRGRHTLKVWCRSKGRHTSTFLCTVHC
jgi:hypothetical protein